MKNTLLLAALMLGAGPALAQTTSSIATPQAAGGIEALDAKNGFRKLRFGTPLAELPTMQKRRGFYMDPMERQVVNDVPLSKLQFFFFEDKLCSVEMATSGVSEPTRLFNSFVALYGPPQTLNDSKWVWAGQKVTVTFTQRMLVANSGYLGVPVKAALVTIDTNEALARRKIREKEKLETPSDGL